MSEVINIKYLSDVPEIKKIVVGDWVDLSAAEDVFLNEGESTIIKLGVAMQLPDGFEALLAPRSSTFKKYGIIQTNSVGVIDETYCGDNDEWGLPVYATRFIHIPKHTRICQFRIIEHQPTLEFRKVQTLGNKNRGGFGSTGEK